MRTKQTFRRSNGTCFTPTQRVPFVVRGVKPEREWLQKKHMTECVVCFDNLRNVACLPCRHIVMCDVCAERMWNLSNQCPVCRTEITEVEYVHADMLCMDTRNPRRYYLRSEAAIARSFDVSVVRSQLMRELS